MDIYYKQSDIAAALSVLMLSSWALECNGTRAAGIQEALHLIQDMINGEVPETMKIPAADVKPAVHGRWIEYPDCLKYPNAYADDHIVCSVCEECFSVLDNDTARFWFCPHCGADLREG